MHKPTGGASSARSAARAARWRSTWAAPVDAGRPPRGELAVSRLRDVTLIDTPGIASLSTEVSARTSTAAGGGGRPAAGRRRRALPAAAHPRQRRAVPRGVPRRRAGPRHAAQRRRGAVAAPTRSGRAGWTRWTVAARVADRYERDPRMHRLCPLVVPVAGLLGQAGTTLREEEYRALATIAALPERAVRRAAAHRGPAASADDADVPLTPLERAHLRGPAGPVRRPAVGAADPQPARCDSATELAQRLAAAAGWRGCAAVLVRQFLRAQPAAAGAVGAGHGPGGAAARRLRGRRPDRRAASRR